MTPSSQRIDIAASAQKLPVDHRISLRIYFRIADNILRQAYIFRNEKNIIDLYVMLLRFSSLVSETLPRHRDYAASPQSKRNSLKKQLFTALNELEALKPAVQQKVDELQRKPANQVIGWKQSNIGSNNHSQNSSIEWPPITGHSLANHQVAKASWYLPEDVSRGLKAQQKVHAIPLEERFQKLSMTFPHPKEETLLRHSILGPNGLSGKWQPPVSDKGVRYPSFIDLTPVEIPRIHQVVAIGGDVALKKDNSSLEPERPILDTVPEPSIDSQKPQPQPQDDEQPMISFDTSIPDAFVVKQPTPPAVLAEVQDLIPSEPPIVTENHDVMDSSSTASFLQPETPMELHIGLVKRLDMDISGYGLLVTEKGKRLLSNPPETPLQLPPSSAAICFTTQCFLRVVVDYLNSSSLIFCLSYKSTSMMETFLGLAKSNTSKNLETCGILAGSLKNRKFYITALIIPKQESTSDTCQATNEEEIFDVQDKRSLFPLGWIHTHPTQSCFMSSVDIHTHYSYQVMLPEAVAIVMAPRDSTKKHGIFRLTTPGGMSVIRHCERRGFHSHEPPADGGPIYKQCTDVYMSSNLKFDVIDLR